MFDALSPIAVVLVRVISVLSLVMKYNYEIQKFGLSLWKQCIFSVNIISEVKTSNVPSYVCIVSQEHLIIVMNIGHLWNWFCRHWYETIHFYFRLALHRTKVEEKGKIRQSSQPQSLMRQRKFILITMLTMPVCESFKFQVWQRAIWLGVW